MSRPEIEPELAEEWDALAERLEVAPWLRPGWIQAWRASFGGGRLELCTVHRRGELVGVLPLERRRGGLSSPTNWHTPGFEPLAVDEDALASLLDAALAQKPRTLALDFLRAGEPGLRAATARARAARYRTTTRPVTSSPYIDLDRDWEAYVATLDRKFLSELRRRRRRLDGEGTVALEVHHGRQRLDELLTEGYRLETSGWKSTHGTAISSSAETRRFYDDVAVWAASRGWLRLCFLRCGERSVAFQLALEQGGRFFLLKSGYDPDYARFSPGLQLRYELISATFDRGLRSFEFLGAAVSWKLEWTSTTRELVRWRAFAPGVAGVAEMVVQTRLRSLASRLRRAHA